MNEPAGKRCTKCGEMKPLTEFNRSRDEADGRRSECRECEHDRRHQRRNENREEIREQMREGSRRYRSLIRDLVLDHYGRQCACCGSTERPTIDHVNGDGRAHRAEVGHAIRMYRWLVANGFPEGFQTLCRPCNRSKGTGAACRINHQATRAQGPLSPLPGLDTTSDAA